MKKLVVVALLAAFVAPACAARQYTPQGQELCDTPGQTTLKLLVPVYSWYELYHVATADCTMQSGASTASTPAAAPSPTATATPRAAN